MKNNTKTIKEKISILLPMYNKKNMKENIQEIMKVMNKIKDYDYDYEIIAIDDGSTKFSSYSEAKKVKSKKVKVIGYKNNMGKGHALKYGFNEVTGDYVIFMDADLELPPHQIKNFMEALKKHKVDVVIGSKRLRGAEVHYPPTRRLMSWVFQMIIRILFGLNVRDTQVGMKLFKYKVLKKVFPKILVKRWAFDVEVLVNANKLGYKIKEIPVRLDFKFSSGIKKRDVINMLLDTAAIFYRLKIIKHYDKN